MEPDGKSHRRHNLFDDSSGAWGPTDGTQASDVPSAADTIAQASANPLPSHGIALSPTAAGLSMVEFMAGLSSNGNLDGTDPNYWNWNADTPATYNAHQNGHAWGALGVTVAYWFDPSSNWTAAEKGAFTDALNLWSGVANINFTLSSAASKPGDAIAISRGSNGQASTGTSYSFNVAAQKNIITSATVSIDTSVRSWSQLYSFSNVGGYGRETVQHELGHALGLGHPGPYNETIPPASQVRYTTDTRQYSIMSYIDAGSTLASQVATNNGDTPSPANYTNSNGTFYLTTPGQYDILAMQRLYGVATSGPLTVGETFGFNPSGALTMSMPQYDFTVNTNPVVTIYDSGIGNSLDLSGFSQASTIDLNPGQFSSADGMVDNIGIAFGTFIDTAIGGSGDDTFYVNAQSDMIDGGGGGDTVVFANNLSSYTLARDGGTVTATSAGITDTLNDVQTLQFADASISAGSISTPCFARGTRILTPVGEIAVEDLHEGALVFTAAGDKRPIKWIGRRTINLVEHPRPSLAAPIRIRRNAFDDGQPRRDLLLSPDHSVFVDGDLIPVSLLVNGCTIVQELYTASVTYLHLELDRHDIVVAEGLAVESYLDTGNRAMFANAGLSLILHPDCSVRYGVRSWERDSCATLLDDGPKLLAARSQLLSRAAALGCHIVTEPDLRLLCGGREIVPVFSDAGRASFLLPAGARRFHLCSRNAVPAELSEQAADGRRLGIAVARIIATNGDECFEVPVDHPGLGHGWHGVERSGRLMWRWTDGAALISLPRPAAAGTLLEIRLHDRLPGYWSLPAPSVRAAA